MVASVLRFYQLGSVPPSPDWDEAALGYNAYSILQTGKDEYNQPFPVVLRSFDDYKPALYVYLAIPPIKVFGLNVFSVRLPSAIFGILTVLATYFLVKELFKRDDLALLSAFLLAISPWHIQFSRVAFETNVGLAFNIFMVLFFIKGLKRPWLLSLSAVFSTFAIYTYQSEKVFTPLLVLTLCIVYYKSLLKLSKKYILAAGIIGAIAIMPMISYISTNKGALDRAQATLAFSDKTTYLKQNIVRLKYDQESGDLLGKIFDNRRVLYLKTGISGYISHFDLNWLFITGDIDRHHAHSMGLLYMWELPFILLGIYSLLFNFRFENWDKRSLQLIFAWFFIAPLPAAFTSGVPHAVRTINFLPTYQVFTAVGILLFFRHLSKTKLKIATIKLTHLIYATFSVVVLLNFFYYIDNYFVQQNYFQSKEWQYGYREAVEYVNENEDRYEKIVVSDHEPLDQSHIFFLFYKRYPPQNYMNNGQRIEKYEFRSIDWSKEDKSSAILYIGRPNDFDENAKVIKTINYLNGEPAIKIVEG